ncbi:DUF6088 family protein [uncultured Duncaniella sp.]|uniref:DUF6088 family protein n=1 Tax=uncultured Duncaniella sp. TaxID=2768039 RepID=UPI00265EA87E|nr:DUF6088 family protein [uncultured Duncaniella sp.]
MIKSIENKIYDSIKRRKNGSIFFASDFACVGNGQAVNKALERLTNTQKILRLSKGIYCKPRIDTELGLGVIYPTLEEIAEAIAKRDRSRIMPTGDYALNRLGLSTQVPMNAVYYTDGTPRKIQIYNGRGIRFLRVAPKRFAFKSKLAAMLTFALLEVGRGNLSEEQERRIKELLATVPQEAIVNDYSLMPDWIRSIIKNSYAELS